MLLQCDVIEEGKHKGYMAYIETDKKGYETAQVNE